MCRRFEMIYSLLCFTFLSGFVFQRAYTEGNVGCLFSSTICEEKEGCFDDNAFGRCQVPYGPDLDTYQHLIGSDTVQLLEHELLRLYDGGYRWKDHYTQCVVQNILYANRHKISYDPGLCSRVMQFTLPDVPPDVLFELESPEPEELAYIKFKPNRDDSDNAMFADEIFSPPISDGRDEEVVDARKRSTKVLDGEDGNDDWLDYLYEHDLKPTDKKLKMQDKESLYRTVLEVGDVTGKLFEQLQNADRYPDDDVPIIRTDLSSDLNQKPAYSEGGIQWVPADSYYLMTNDINDPQEKKRIRLPNEIIDDDDIPMIGREVEIDEMPSENKESIPIDDSIADNLDSDNLQFDDEDDKNFRWNYKHLGKNVVNLDNDLTKFAKPNKNGRRKVAGSERNKINDVIEDDYLEDQLYAILPADNDKSTFTRDMRYDTKKPGPSYMIHEDEDGVSDEDDIDMAANGARVFVSSLSKSAQKGQLIALLKTPVVAQKSSAVVVPSREVIEAAQRIVVTGENEIPSDRSDRSKQQSKDKMFERLHSDQPEMLEGIDELTSKELKDEDRMANAAQTGEGHIGHYEAVDATHAYLHIKEKGQSEEDVKSLVDTLGSMLNLPKGSFSDVRIDDRQITFKVNPNAQNLNASDVAAKAEEQYAKLKELTGITVDGAGIGDKVKYEVINPNKDRRLFILTFALCGGVAGILVAVAAAYLVRRHARTRDKIQNVTQPDSEPSQDYQDLCRQRMASKSNDKPETIHSVVHSPKRIRSLSQEGQASSSSHSSTSSWNEEPVTSNMDISTGHIILAYMEDHLKNKDRLDREWESLCAYEAELCSTTAATQPQNIKKNRYTDVLPYDHSRVLLTEASNVNGSNYINASSITDHDPRNPAYIATQGPLPQTAADFWQMIWEQGSVVIVMLSRLMENGVAMCHRYWPEEGSEVYHIYEVHLVSEHIWCDDYLVRSFYLKNLRTNETRTVTQFHFMSWPDNGVPNSTKALLEFRRKVNKSYRGRSCPIVVHCSDGIGRTGTYCLIDMVLNRMAKGAKEIDIAATLEHVRDQRAGMVKTKAQFEFVLMAIAEEVHAILKALSQ